MIVWLNGTFGSGRQPEPEPVVPVSYEQPSERPARFKAAGRRGLLWLGTLATGILAALIQAHFSDRCDPEVGRPKLSLT